MWGPWGPQTDIFYFVCVVLVVIYPFHASLGLNHFDFSDYNKIYLDVAHIEAHFANLGDFGPFQGSLGAPKDPKPIFFSLFV
jgi:hypothetical protein